MRPDNRYTLSYIRVHPAEAARTLERLPAEAGGALFESLDIEVIAPLLACMSPPAAAACLARIAPARAADLLQRLRATAAALILSAMPPEPAGELLRRFGTTARLRVRRLLNRHPDTVGALMSPGAPALPAALTVADAIRRIQQQRPEPVCDLYLVDDAYRLVGVVNTAALLKAGERRPLRSLTEREDSTLHASMTLSTARNHPAWRGHRVLPVTENDGTLIGTLDRQALIDAMENSRGPAREDPLDNMLELVNLYWIALAETVRMMAGPGDDRRPE